MGNFFLMKEEGRRLGIPQAQVPTCDGSAQFTLNTLDHPEVPVLVRVQPPEAHAVATLRWASPDGNQSRQPNREPWQFPAEAGKYSFFADFADNQYKVNPYIDEIVRPPYWAKPLKVQP